MNTDKIGIRNLAEICEKKGVKYAVISPGSRNAPLTAAFLNQANISCISIVDERSAAFFALGIAQQTHQPVAIICTSGSSVLNYAPAIAEAFYQKIPLLVLTADRPNEWIDQGENQSIHQYRIYHNYIKKSFELPIEPATEKDIWFSDRLISEAINICRYPEAGPVHINIPLREPLYELNTQENPYPPKIVETTPYEPRISDDARNLLLTRWQQAKRKMIICGATSNAHNLHDILAELNKDPNVIILSESNSNVNLAPEEHIACIDRSIEVVTKQALADFIPEIIITFGAGIVSKKIKFLFRGTNSIEHWHLTLANEHWDTFQNLSQVINESPNHFLAGLSTLSRNTDTNYKKQWLNLDRKLATFHQAYLNELSFCDFKVFEYLIQQFPNAANVHYGNSTPIRYANLFETPIAHHLQINANRGVSGIDGVTSTAAGAAFAHPTQTTICISGDLAFFYDSNALWNHYVLPNLKIIVINNGGGNIFRIIPGPSKMPQFEQFTETKHQASVALLSQSFGLKHYFCDSMESLQQALLLFFQPHQTAAVLEIRTDAAYSADALKNYFTIITKKYEQESMANH